jgi:hypothetical protein
LAFLALLKRNIFVHFSNRRSGLWKTCRVRKAHQSISADPIFLNKIAVKMGDTKQILRARITASSGCIYIRHRFLAAAILEQQQAIIVSRLGVSLCSSAFVKRFGPARIGFYAAAKTECLGHIKLRIRVAFGSWARPFAHCGGVITSAPRIDASFDISKGWPTKG